MTATKEVYCQLSEPTSHPVVLSLDLFVRQLNKAPQCTSVPSLCTYCASASQNQNNTCLKAKVLHKPDILPYNTNTKWH